MVAAIAVGYGSASRPISVGSVGDSYDNALAETINGLYKAEVIHRRGPGAASRRSSSPLSNGSTGSTTAASSNRLETAPPAEAEAAYYAQFELTHVAA